ncbi:MAG: YdcF family protein [Erysipelotrichaceae bacterium]|nr:YdcF family protein [Erysipelotrichaceae bacterium]MDD3809002.1 YdcF family protein [Erysipelotrichaceae bacterium]
MKIFKLISRVIISVIVIAVGINIFVVLVGQGNKISASTEKYDCIVVLGCSVYNDNPSAMLKDRLEKAVELYFDGYGDTILMSGDVNGEYYDEVAVMREFAIERGVPESAVITDSNGFSTYASMYSLMENYSYSKYLIVTQPYHLYRSLFIGRMLGLSVDGIGSEGNNYPGQLERDVREFFARIKDTINIVFRNEPNYVTRKDDIIELDVLDDFISDLF